MGSEGSSSTRSSVAVRAMRRDGDSSEPKTLLEPKAASTVGRHLRERVVASIDTTGKALTVIAGLGIFFFATGYFVEWQRLHHNDLPPEEILPLIPKAQVAAAGVRELVVSILFGGLILAALGIGLVRLARFTKPRSGRLSRTLNRICEKDAAFLTIGVGIVTVLVAPATKLGLFAAAVSIAMLFYGLCLVQRFLASSDGAEFPLWRLSAAVAITAVTLCGARQWEFPEARPVARAVLTDHRIVRGSYVASDSNEILIREWPTARATSRLRVLERNQVKSFELHSHSAVYTAEPSLFDMGIELLFPNVRFTCIPPECRVGKNQRLGPSSLF